MSSYKPLIALALVPVFVFFGIVGIPMQVWNGNHTGVITAIDTSGIFIKSTTVYFKTDSNSSQEDYYCLKDESILPSLQSLQESKQVVTINYQEYLANGMDCATSTSVITSVK